MRVSQAPRVLLLTLAGLGLGWGAGSPAAGTDPPAGHHLAAADEAWAGRAAGAPAGEPGRAAPEPVARAIALYEEAVAAEPGRLEARWKLLRALYFEGEHAARGSAHRQEVFDRGRRVAEAALDRLAERAGGRKALEALPPAERAARLARDSEAAAIHFWAAVHWGLWGDAFGRLAAARQGVAGRIRDYAETALALDETYERAGPHRVLGRLHALAPRVPFLTGWIDRGRAIAELERAVARSPEEPLNRLYLAEALLEHAPNRRAEALDQLRALLRRPPDPDRVIEEAAARRAAREILEREGR
jgi:tetratricopeptide (TPR) repeat protein